MPSPLESELGYSGGCGSLAPRLERAIIRSNPPPLPLFPGPEKRK
jgi:hypothetical protein